MKFCDAVLKKNQYAHLFHIPRSSGVMRPFRETAVASVNINLHRQSMAAQGVPNAVGKAIFAGIFAHWRNNPWFL